MHHLCAKKTVPHFAEQSHTLAGSELPDLTAVEIEKAQINRVGAIFRLHHQLAARPVGNFVVHYLGFHLTRHACPRIGNVCQPRFIFVTNRQVQRKVPVITQIEFREFGRQGICRAASLAMSTPVALPTKGTVREARGLTSST